MSCCGADRAGYPAKDPDPVEALAFVIDGRRLWGGEDGVVADRALMGLPGWLDDDEWEERWDAILEDVSRRLYDDRHHALLRSMVAEVARQLPLSAYPDASAVLAEGCARFEADPSLGPHVAARLLADVLPVPGGAALRGRRAA
jgi:hypothetical protein